MLTVLIPCKDEIHNLLACVESVRCVADEILVADSGSTDGTLELAKSLPGVRVIEREFIGFASFKNWAIAKATGDWVLIIDADERLTPRLANEIIATLQNPKHEGYSTRFAIYLLGRRLRFSGTQSARSIRLIRSHLRYNELRVHEDIDYPLDQVGLLQGKFDHHTVQFFKHSLGKQNRYTSLGAEDAFHSGKRIYGIDIIVRPPVKFVYAYFVRGGCLDGLAGWIWCSMVAFYSFQKCVKIWELQQQQAVAKLSQSTAPIAADNATSPARRIA